MLKKLNRFLLCIFLSSVASNSNCQNVVEALKAQLNDYMKALTTGNVDKVVYYEYPDMFIWMKKEAKTLGTTYTIEDFKKDLIKISDDMKSFNGQKGFEISWTFDPIVKKATYKNYLIYTSVTSLIIKKDYTEIKNGDISICVSTDYGKSWKFINKNTNNTKDILKMRFPEYIVQQIMN
jgi:hypothetical protein